MENNMLAEQDCKKALELDPNNFKGYWRLAEICRVTQQYKQAIQYYKQAQKINPKSYQIAKAILDIEKVEKTINPTFDLQKALAGIQIRSLSEVKNKEDQQQLLQQRMQQQFPSQQIHAVPEGNRTFIIPQDIEQQTFEQKNTIFQALREYIIDKQNLLSTSQMQLLLKKVNVIFDQRKIVDNITLPYNAEYYVVGDFHGNIKDAKEVLNIINDKLIVQHDQLTHLIILGDMVDRGTQSTQILTLMYMLQVLYPNNVHIIRGNHESISLNQLFGFQQEFYTLYSDNNLFMDIQDTFKNTPVCLLIDEQNEQGQYQETTMCVHGGCPVVNQFTDINDLKNLQVKKDYEYEDPTVKQMLWNDPQPGDDSIKPSYRGVGYLYGKSSFQDFKQKMNIKRVFRGHEVVYDNIGVRDDFGDKTHVTVFSSSKYQGNINGGGIILRKIGTPDYKIIALDQ